MCIEKPNIAFGQKIEHKQCQVTHVAHFPHELRQLPSNRVPLTNPHPKNTAQSDHELRYVTAFLIVLVAWMTRFLTQTSVLKYYVPFSQKSDEVTWKDHRLDPWWHNTTIVSASYPHDTINWTKSRGPRVRLAWMFFLGTIKHKKQWTCYPCCRHLFDEPSW